MKKLSHEIEERFEAAKGALLDLENNLIAGTYDHHLVCLLGLEIDALRSKMRSSLGLEEGETP